MEDLDLDELDQAVNKMMEKPQKTKRAVKKSVSSAETASVLSVSQPDREPKEEDTAVPAPAEPAVSAVPVSRPMPAVPPRRRMHPGAMDIIQPHTPKMGAPSRAAGRVGRDIAPTKPIAPESPRPVAPTGPAPAPQKVPEQEAVDVADEVLASLNIHDEPATPKTVTKPVTTPATPKKETENNWPDPLDFHDFTDEVKEPKETPPSMESKPRPDPDALLDESVTTSPFVTTKVQKRPLGAYADAAQAAQPDDAAETVSVIDQAPSKGEMAQAAIQSNQHLEKPEEQEPDMNQLRSMAIPPQYHTAEQKPSEEVHNLFDTKEYHAAPQQMGHPIAKKSGSAWFVIAVVVLITLIVAAAVIGYFMMTGTLDLTKIL